MIAGENQKWSGCVLKQPPPSSPTPSPSPTLRAAACQNHNPFVRTIKPEGGYLYSGSPVLCCALAYPFIAHAKSGLFFGTAFHPHAATTAHRRRIDRRAPAHRPSSQCGGLAAVWHVNISRYLYATHLIPWDV